MPAIDKKPPRAWVRLPSGRRLNLLDPTPLDFEPSDLALGSARTFRWGGHSIWPWPLSVAQHAMSVLAIGRQQLGDKMTPKLALAFLLHDASECLGVCFDPISPLKPFLGPGYAALDKALQGVVHTRFGLPSVLPDAWKKPIKKADRLAAAAEAVFVAGWSEQECREALQIKLPLLEEDPLQERFGMRPWEPWTPAVAAERFAAELEGLVDLSSRT
ncbi:phosphohydrolase [Lacibacterium aquatile]|uniref:Phosphohydrolase n=1 Tax=Lacibacterium aquatile TaxID=1168082 RepID=A0ABW5DWY3_9PROT